MNNLFVNTELSWKQTDAAKTREQLIQHQLQELHTKIEKLQAEASRAEGKRYVIDSFCNQIFEIYNKFCQS